MSGTQSFVERRDESFYLVGSRVPLACIVREFHDGQSPEAIRSAFPTLTLEQVYGAITFYLGNRAIIDPYLEQGKAEFARLRQEARQKHPLLYAKLDAAKRETLSRRS